MRNMVAASRCLSIFSFALAVVSLLAKTSSESLSSSLKGKRTLVVGVDGGTESIRACCFDAATGAVVGKSCAAAYKTYHPKPGLAEQHPSDWWKCMGQAVKGAVNSIPSDGGVDFDICGICVDTTCCSVVALDDKNEALRPCLLWMDARSAPQTQEIMEKCRGESALKVNSGGDGPISAEWMTPKALWIHQNEPDVWKKAKTICEYQDYINYKLTGEICASSCNAASRWHWDGEACIKDSSEENPYPGRPLSMYEKLGIPELASKLPRRCLSMGSLVGHLTPEAAVHLGLPLGLPVAQGGADAFVGMIGLGCVNPGQVRVPSLVCSFVHLSDSSLTLSALFDYGFVSSTLRCLFAPTYFSWNLGSVSRSSAARD
jgi:ribulose kinase